MGISKMSEQNFVSWLQYQSKLPKANSAYF